MRYYHRVVYEFVARQRLQQTPEYRLIHLMVCQTVLSGFAMGMLGYAYSILSILQVISHSVSCLLYLEEVAMDVAFYNWLRLRDQLGQGEDGEDREEEGDEGDEEEEEEE
ncbi:MAG: hypothetical protein M1821_000607 [Bathelium mastoideum]|nr:MAG: hypothetical protein M1821_000607 [Bathelium mastoideum]